MGCCQGSKPREGAGFEPVVNPVEQREVVPDPVPPQAEEGEQLGLAPVSPLVAQRGTPFGIFLEAGHMAVVRATYFKECWHRGVPFQDRANIPVEAFIDGKEVVDLWVEFGYAFLVVVSYPWLSKGHPDPNNFHLPRLVRALEIFKHYHDQESWKGDKRNRVLELEGGVIIDFCSFWQGKRSEEEDRLFKEGLNLINIPYGHRDVTALKLVSTPPTEVRLYDDRGWTHFESTVIDGKAPSARHSLLGKRNVLTCGNSFEPQGATCSKEVEALGNFQRKPPLTPARFREELEVRRERAKAKGERLFTTDKDSPVILDRYDASFAELCHSTKLNYFNMRWGVAEARDLALALPFFGALEDLNLSQNGLNGEAAAALAAALPRCPVLHTLNLYGNNLGDSAEAAAALAIALPQCNALRTLHLGVNKLGRNREAAAALMAALGECARLEDVNLLGNGLGAEATAAFAAVLPRCRALHTLNLAVNDLGNSAEAALALAAALPQCRALHTLDLLGNNFSISAQADLRRAWGSAGREAGGLEL